MPPSNLYFQELEMNDFAAVVRYSNGGYRQGGSSLTIFDAPELGNNFYIDSSMTLMDKTVLQVDQATDDAGELKLIHAS